MCLLLAGSVLHGMFEFRFYTLFTLVVEIVLFNVISAMFVESTMEAAAHISNLKRRERLQASECLVKGAGFGRLLATYLKKQSLASGMCLCNLERYLSSALLNQKPETTHTYG